MSYRARCFRPERGCRVTTAATTTELMMMLLTGYSGIDLNASVNELPCFRKLRIELTENATFQAVRFTFPDSRFSVQVDWIVNIGRLPIT
jgi:hypothetical protein